MLPGVAWSTGAGCCGRGAEGKGEVPMIILVQLGDGL